MGQPFDQVTLLSRQLVRQLLNPGPSCGRPERWIRVLATAYTRDFGWGWMGAAPLMGNGYTTFGLYNQRPYFKRHSESSLILPEDARSRREMIGIHCLGGWPTSQLGAESEKRPLICSGFTAAP